MKLADAIRLGAMIRPQGFHQFFPVGMYGETSCTLGAAYEALGWKDYDCVRRGEDLYNAYPFLIKAVKCPECPGTTNLHLLIIHLNDGHKWTRERIADFIEQFEPAVEGTIPAPTEAVAV